MANNSNLDLLMQTKSKDLLHFYNQVDLDKNVNNNNFNFNKF